MLGSALGIPDIQWFYLVSAKAINKLHRRPFATSEAVAGVCFIKKKNRYTQNSVLRENEEKNSNPDKSKIVITVAEFCGSSFFFFFLKKEREL